MYKNWLEQGLDFIYPRRCPICGEIVVPKGNKVCVQCQMVPKVIMEPRCKKCSKSIDKEEQEYCYDCQKKKHHYKQGLALWNYDEVMRKSISYFKYGGRREYSVYYVEEVIIWLSKQITQWCPGAIIPVPLHPTKERFRGFNQAKDLADGIGEHLGILVLSDILVRCRKTKPQKELNNLERAKNLEQAFRIKKGKEDVLSQQKRVVLVDDIYTTGSTIEACTKVLQKAGVQDVYFLSLCIGKGF